MQNSPEKQLPTSIYMDPDLKRQLRMHVAEQGISQTEAIETAIRAYLDAPVPAQPRPSREMRERHEDLDTLYGLREEKKWSVWHRVVDDILRTMRKELRRSTE